ncbi:MAG: hypothetical protein ACFB3T_03330 [Geminicoccaceae bacterium]
MRTTMTGRAGLGARLLLLAGWLASGPAQADPRMDFACGCSTFSYGECVCIYDVKLPEAQTMHVRGYCPSDHHPHARGIDIRNHDQRTTCTAAGWSSYNNRDFFSRSCTNGHPHNSDRLEIVVTCGQNMMSSLFR